MNQILHIESFGLCTARYQNILLLNQNDSNMILVAPAATQLNIFQLDFKENQIKLYKRISTNSATISSVLKNKKYIFASDDNGQTTILDQMNFNIMTQIKSSQAYIKHSSVCNQYFIAHAEGCTKICTGITDIWKLPTEQIISSKNIEHNFSLKGKYKYPEISSNEQILFLIFSKNEKVKPNKQINQKNNKNYIAIIYDLLTKQQIKETVIPSKNQIIASSFDCINNINALLFLDKVVIILNILNLEIMLNIKFQNAGIIQSLYLSNSSLHLIPTNGYYCEIDINNCIKQLKNSNHQQILLNIEDQNQNDFIQKNTEKNSLISQRNYYIQYFHYNNQYFILTINEKGIYIFEKQFLPKEQQLSIKLRLSKNCHSNIYCGICSDKQENQLCIGDLSGNVFIFDTNEKQQEYPNISPKISNQFGIGVRCLVWDHIQENQTNIFIGTFNGDIYIWNSSTNKIYILFQEKNLTILCLRLHSNGSLLLASTISGEILLFQRKNKNLFEFIYRQLIHFPQDSNLPQNLNFGTLKKQAEVWSIQWNPQKNKYRFASTSEEQLVKVFEFQNVNSLENIELKEIISPLQGNTLAVTSVDWQIMNSQLGEIMATCSDDKSIRVYLPELNFKQKEIFNIDFIKEWFTLTYLALNTEGKYLAVGGQTGYLFLINLVSSQIEWFEKIHMGGVEGLIWQNQILMTCSSDNIYNICKLIQNQDNLNDSKNAFISQ